MATPTNTPQQPDLPATQSASERNRRRVIQSGLAAAPLLMTLLSRPVLGAVACGTPSALLSASASRPAGPPCSGQPPAFWADRANFTSWPAAYVPETTGVVDATPFSPTFSPPLTYVPPATLLDVLNLPVNQDDVACYSVAALLNADANLTPPLPSTVVQGIWRDYASNGYFEPTAGVKWYAADIVTYFKSTMSV